VTGFQACSPKSKRSKSILARQSNWIKFLARARRAGVRYAYEEGLAGRLNLAASSVIQATEAAPPARALWTARIKSPSCRHEVGLRNQLLRHGLGAVRCIGVDVLAYSPPPAAML
jgi:hypothetical protein